MSKNTYVNPKRTHNITYSIDFVCIFMFPLYNDNK